jgi:hypothetical protein
VLTVRLNYVDGVFSAQIAKIGRLSEDRGESTQLGMPPEEWADIYGLIAEFFNAKVPPLPMSPPTSNSQSSPESPAGQ